MSETDYVFVRPNGKPYRPRITHLRAQAWENLGHFDEETRGVVVLGTLNPEEAWQLGWTACASWYGDTDSFGLSHAEPGWWRDTFDRGERTWLYDDDHGVPGVMFTWSELDFDDMNWCTFCLIPRQKGQQPPHKPNCPTL